MREHIPRGWREQTERWWNDGVTLAAIDRCSGWQVQLRNTSHPNTALSRAKLAENPSAPSSTNDEDEGTVAWYPLSNVSSYVLAVYWVHRVFQRISPGFI